MITLSSRFLAVLLIAVVAVSVAGSMAGYALGSRGQRAGLAEALAGPATTPKPEALPTERAAGALAPEPDAPAPAVPPPQPARPARIADTPSATGLALGATAARGGVAVTMTDAQASSWEPGLEVRLMLNNTSGSDLRFPFMPEQQLRLEDNRGVHWNIRWAEYEGEVSLPNGEKRQLVRAWYHGELQHPGVESLTLILRGTPELAEASWTFPAPRLPASARP